MIQVKQFTTSWLNNDPRYTIGKRAKIMVYNPHTESVHSGYVDVKTTYSIWIYQKEFASWSFLSADDNWPEFLWWTWAPELQELKDE